MSFAASTIGTIPQSGFSWYLIFLEGPFADEIKKQIDEHFSTLGREAGPDVLVVRGYDPTSFRKSVYEATAFYEDEWKERAMAFPAILVTDKSPSLALSNGEELRKAKVMIFPLEEIYHKKGRITGFLVDLLEALNNENSSEALKKLDKSNLEKGWGWLRRYVEIKPAFFGFSFDVNAAMDDIISRS